MSSSNRPPPHVSECPFRAMMNPGLLISRLIAHESRQMRDHIWKDNAQDHHNNLEANKWNYSSIDVAGLNLRWRDPSQIENRIREWRRQKGNLEVHHNQDSKPDGIETKSLGDRSNQRNDYKHYTDPIDEHSDHDQESHNDKQKARLAELHTDKEPADYFIAAESNEHRSEERSGNSYEQYHTGYLKSLEAGILHHRESEGDHGLRPA